MGIETKKDSDRISIGRIPLKQVRVKRQDVEPGQGPAPAAAAEPEPEPPAKAANPMNRLVPYLDLFCRLDDEELAVLAKVDTEVAATLRKQVVTIDRGLERYVDLLPRLDDTELVRLTGASLKTIRFWRLCQPRMPAAKTPGTSHNARPKAAPTQVSAANEQGREIDTRPASSTAAPAPSDSADQAGGESVARFMNFAGDPFPGYDNDAAIPTPPPTDVGAAAEEHEPS